MSSPSPREVVVLLVFDSATGAATLPVGAVGVQGECHHISWLPLEPAADVWRARLHPSAAHPSMRAALQFWAAHANGVTLAVQPVEAEVGGSLVDTVEAVVDGLLCHRAGEVSAGGQ